MSDPRFSNALFTDLYELTMAQAYWQHDWQAEATFSMFFREHPPDCGYLVYAGLEDFLNYVDEFWFEERDIEHLRTSVCFDDAFLGWLADLRFTGFIRSMMEGEIFFANEPVLSLSTGSLAGRKQVWRVPDGSQFGQDVIARADEIPPAVNATPLLHDVVRDGKRGERARRSRSSVSDSRTPSPGCRSRSRPCGRPPATKSASHRRNASYNDRCGMRLSHASWGRRVRAPAGLATSHSRQPPPACREGRLAEASCQCE